MEHLKVDDTKRGGRWSPWRPRCWLDEAAGGHGDSSPLQNSALRELEEYRKQRQLTQQHHLPMVRDQSNTLNTVEYGNSNTQAVELSITSTYLSVRKKYFNTPLHSQKSSVSE